MSRSFRFVFALAILFLPLRAGANTITMFTSQAAWNGAASVSKSVNFTTYFAAHNIAEYLTGPQTFAGMTFNSFQANCGATHWSNQMYADDGSSTSPAGLYAFVYYNSNSCYMPGSSALGLPVGSTAFAFTIQSWPGNNVLGPAFLGGVSLYTGAGTLLGTFGGLDIHQPTFVGFTSTVPITFMYLNLTPTCVNCQFQEFAISSAAYGTAGGHAATPEPSSLLLFASGLAGLTSRFRRRPLHN